MSIATSHKNTHHTFGSDTAGLSQSIHNKPKEGFVSFQHRPATDGVIRHGYATKRPVRDIAEQLGCSRNVVIGRAHRLGIAAPAPHRVGVPHAAPHPAMHKLQDALEWAEPERWVGMSEPERDRFITRYLSRIEDA